MADADDDGQGAFIEVVHRRKDKRKQDNSRTYHDKKGSTRPPPKVHPGGYHNKDSTNARKYTFKLYDEDTIRWIEHMYNNYFKTITGKPFDLQMTPHSQPYFTSLETRRHLDTILKSLYRKRPVIWDLMCGIGGDALGMLMYLFPATLTLVDKQFPREQGCLHHNINQMIDTFPEVFKGQYAPRVEIHHQSYAEFIAQYAKQHNTAENPIHVDLVYLDPPWDREKIWTEMHEMFQYAQHDAETTAAMERAEETGQASSKLDEIEVDLKIILIYINEIAALLKHFNINASTICFKNRFRVKPDMFEDLTERHAKYLHGNFTVLYSVQCISNEKKRKPEADDNHDWRRGQFHWVVMRHNGYLDVPDYKHKWVKQDQLGARDFWVDPDTYFTPYKPPYSQAMPYPEIISDTEYRLLTDANQIEKFIPAPRHMTHTEFDRWLELSRKKAVPTDDLVPDIEKTKSNAQLVKLLRQLQRKTYK